MRYAWIEGQRDWFCVSRLCRLLEVSRSGYCQWRVRCPSDRARSNAALDMQVASLHAQSKRSYGRARIVRGLRTQGLQVGHERVRKSLRRQGLRPAYRRPYRVTTKCDPGAPVAGNVLDRSIRGVGAQSRVGRRYHLCGHG